MLCLWSAQVGEEVLGMAAKVTVSKESTTIVGDGRAEESVAARVRQIKNMIAETEQDYEKEKLNERMARLSGGVAVIQVRLCLRVHFTSSSTLRQSIHFCRHMAGPTNDHVSFTA